MQGCPPFLFYFRFVGESDAPLALSSGRQVSIIFTSQLIPEGMSTNVPYVSLLAASTSSQGHLLGTSWR